MTNNLHKVRQQEEAEWPWLLAAKRFTTGLYTEAFYRKLGWDDKKKGCCSKSGWSAGSTTWKGSDPIKYTWICAISLKPHVPQPASLKAGLSCLVPLQFALSLLPKHPDLFLIFLCMTSFLISPFLALLHLSNQDLGIIL